MNVTEARSKIPAIVKKSKRGQSTILLKNGEPLVAIVNYKDFLEYERLKEARKRTVVSKAFRSLQGEFENNETVQEWIGKEVLSEEAMMQKIVAECKSIRASRS